MARLSDNVRVAPILLVPIGLFWGMLAPELWPAMGNGLIAFGLLVGFVASLPWAGLMTALAKDRRKGRVFLLMLGIRGGIIKVSPRPSGAPFDIRAGFSVYNGVRAGDEVLVTTSAGRLGERWVVDVQKLEAP